MGVDCVGDMPPPPLLIKRKFIPRTFSGKCVHVEVFGTSVNKSKFKYKR